MKYCNVITIIISTYLITIRSITCPTNKTKLLTSCSCAINSTTSDCNKGQYCFSNKCQNQCSNSVKTNCVCGKKACINKVCSDTGCQLAKDNIMFWHNRIINTISKDDISVVTDIGTIKGRTPVDKWTTPPTEDTTQKNLVDTFQGIPYAEPPINNLRFEKTVELKRNIGKLNASSVCPSCIGNKVFNENCLCLNICRPKKFSGKLPVMVHISTWSSDGSDLNLLSISYSQKSIRVSLNFRVGLYGFSAFKENIDAGYGTGGSNGILDVITALKWVKRNIAKFGGDPDNVSIVGGSSGGNVACVLTVSPLAKGLFKRSVLAAGGVCIGGWGPNSLEFSLKMTKAQIKPSKLYSKSDVKNHKLFKNNYTLTKFQGQERTYDKYKLYKWPIYADLEVMGYWVDGYVIPEHPQYSFQDKSKINVDQIMLGGSSYDGANAFIIAAFHIQNKLFTNASYNSQMQEWWPFKEKLKTEQVIANYPLKILTPKANKQMLTVMRSNSDWTVTCQNMKVAQFFNSHGIPAYYFQFRQGPKKPLSPYPMMFGVNNLPYCDLANNIKCQGFAAHGEDSLFLNDSMMQKNYIQGNEAKLLNSYINLVSTFQATGKPQDSTNFAPKWESYNKNKTIMYIDLPMLANETFNETLCDWWQKQIPINEQIDRSNYSKIHKIHHKDKHYQWIIALILGVVIIIMVALILVQCRGKCRFKNSNKKNKLIMKTHDDTKSTEEFKL